MTAGFELAGQNAIVTGGGTGIGRAIALEYARNGSNIAIVYNKSRKEAEETAQEIRESGRLAVVVQADLTREDDVVRMTEEATAALGEIHILLNNAGTMVQRQPIDEMELSLWLQIMDVNLTSVFLVSKHISRIMKAQGRGRMINVASVAARNGGSYGSVAYAAAKGAVHTFTKGLAKELAPYGVLVNAIAPGVIATRFHDQYTSREARMNFAKLIPLGREGTAEEVTGAAMLLASAYGSYITGEMIEVNGGLLMD